MLSDLPQGLHYGSTKKTISGTPSTPGEYIVILKATDKAGNVSDPKTSTFKITILDKTLPMITLSGSATVSLVKGKVYQELGATCSDNVDVTCAVVIRGTIDSNTLGEQTITYTATDKA